jgi:hypothetical protein
VSSPSFWKKKANWALARSAVGLAFQALKGSLAATNETSAARGAVAVGAVEDSSLLMTFAAATHLT